jgi:hypothetical protein
MNTNDREVSAIGDDLTITERTPRAYGPGTRVTGTLNGHRFVALVFSEHAKSSCFELGKSRISKLWLERLSDGNVVCNFDRGWDIRPTDLTAAAVADFLAAGLAELTYGHPHEEADRKVIPGNRAKACGKAPTLHGKVHPKKDIDF